MIYAATAELLPIKGWLDIRGGEAVRKICDRELCGELPTIVQTASEINDVGVGFCVAPDHWMLCLSDGEDSRWEGKFQKALSGEFCSITNVSDMYLTFRLEGRQARDVLLQAVSADLHPRVFSKGSFLRTAFAKTTAMVYQTSDEPAYDVTVYRSYKSYVGEWFSQII
jgi:sarcosine oxidase subunit gamma